MGIQSLYGIRKVIWSEKKIPKDWREGIIIPVYKKGDTKD